MLTNAAVLMALVTLGMSAWALAREHTAASAACLCAAVTLLLLVAGR